MPSFWKLENELLVRKSFTHHLDFTQKIDRIGVCPKTGGIRSQTEGKPSRGTQHRSSGSGLVIRAVCLVGLPDGTNDFDLIKSERSEPQIKSTLSEPTGRVEGFSLS